MRRFPDFISLVLVLAAAILPARADVMTQPSAPGRAITGKIALPAELNGRDWTAQGWLETRLALPDIKLPADILQMNPARRLAWFKQWQQTSSGRRTSDEREELILDKRRHPEFSGQNSFRIESVPLGEYVMSVRFYAKSDKSNASDPPVATASYRFSVPSIGPASAPPLDVGTLAPEPIGIVNAGQPVPDFVFAASDGKDHLLSEFKGKIIWLDFWGVWCGDCHRDLPDLKKLHETFGANPRFAMISLSVDDKEPVWRDYIAKNNMNWTQGILGDRDNAWQLNLMEITSYPTYWIIGADGKVVANGYRCGDLMPTLERVLKDRKN
jgi:thiol-disulfide isomerase/thioredoxin